MTRDIPRSEHDGDPARQSGRKPKRSRPKSSRGKPKRKVDYDPRTDRDTILSFCLDGEPEAKS